MSNYREYTAFKAKSYKASTGNTVYLYVANVMISFTHCKQLYYHSLRDRGNRLNLVLINGRLGPAGL